MQDDLLCSASSRPENLRRSILIKATTDGGGGRSRASDGKNREDLQHVYLLTLTSLRTTQSKKKLNPRFHRSPEASFGCRVESPGLLVRHPLDVCTASVPQQYLKLQTDDGVSLSIGLIKQYSTAHTSKVIRESERGGEENRDA